MYSSEVVEHFFDVARQINPNFTYVNLIHLIPKIAQHSKALRNNNIIYEKEKLYLQFKIIINIKF